MTAAVFIGCSFIAFGPALALCVCTIAAEPLRLLFLIAGGFFWLVSLLLSSLVWFIAVQIGGSNNASVKKNLLIFGVMVSVLLQEVFRFAYYKLLKKANKGLMTISQEETLPISVRQLSYVSGLGFGIMSGVFSLVNILTDSLGPGTVGIYGDSPQYFLSSADSIKVARKGITPGPVTEASVVHRGMNSGEAEQNCWTIIRFAHEFLKECPLIYE
ncbi:gamma-secretase subunit APH-1B isoform X3 [Malaclemys terrapin pileata]|uniref:gamma-secretase subunit APH-1B isoform X3 n=1 Tax=Malaclemys terrapin pileata TaxID=2991368 RepID=UPI0023A7F0E3|nr:gamma-secretase subunit APH-1B isoform X3 [Malaclemys terrapin pileata]